VAAWLVAPTTLAQAPAAVPPRSDTRPEVVIIGTREADALLAARVEQALEKDPYLYVRHMSITAENGIVRVEGYVEDAADMMQVLRLARRVAGKRRVINEIEVVTGSVDHD
jgi:osmotically-inducible protein OsmY